MSEQSVEGNSEDPSAPILADAAVSNIGSDNTSQAVTDSEAASDSGIAEISETAAAESIANPENNPPPTLERPAEFPANAGAMLATKRVNVAAIGDVSADWAFISREPARPRFPVFKPWTRDPASYVFAFPGGAWLAGHLLQGAIHHPPVFRRTYRISTRKAPSPFPTHLALSGTVDPRRVDKQAVFTISPPINATGDSIYDAIYNDEFEIGGRSAQDKLSRLQISIKTNSSPSQLRFELGLTDAFLPIEDEYSATPGYFGAEQVLRHFEADNVLLRAARPGPHQYECTYCVFSNVELIIKPYFMSADQAEYPVEEVKASSLRFVPKTIRRGDIVAGPPSQFSLSHNLLLKHVLLDVTYGHLSAFARYTDRGKLNPPSPAIGQRSPSATLSVELQSEHFPVADLAGRVWYYANPGSSVVKDSGQIVHTVSELGKYKRYASQRSDRMVYRRSKYHGVDGPQHGYPTVLDVYEHNKYFDVADYERKNELSTYSDWMGADGTLRLLCVDDEGLGFTRRCDKWAPFLLPPNLFPSGEQLPKSWNALKKHLDDDAALLPKITQHIQHTWFIIKASHWLDSTRADLIYFLQKCDALDRTLLIVSGESLRDGLTSSSEKPGIKLAKTVSWERTVEDFERALRTRALGILGECQHIVVRLGLEGVLYAQKRSPEAPAMSLWFDPERIEGEYADSATFGEVPGLTSVMMAVLAKGCTEWLASRISGTGDNFGFGNAINSALEGALRGARRYYDLGYGASPGTVRKIARLQLPLSQVFSNARVDGLMNAGRHKIVNWKCEGSRDDGSWSILSELINKGGRHTESLDFVRDDIERLRSKTHENALRKAIRAVTLGRRIVLRGAGKTFELTAEPFPYAAIGDLVAVDRREIEGLRSIRSVLSEYVRNKERKIPLSVAVFGPPGSGKSFAVKQIAKRVTEGNVKDFVFNLAQFSSFQELARVLLRVRDPGHGDKIPLVFFDEFDCAYGSEPLGWLKFFLSLMQDGQFQHEDSMLGIGRAVLVFAGGIASSHVDFEKADFWDQRFSRSNLFATAKGPDFHSRLRGFLDILGPNPSLMPTPTPKSEDDDSVKRFDRFAEDDFTFVIRRATLIRQKIEEIHRESNGGLLDSEGRAEIDRDFLDALLLTDSYKHGVRSLNAIFEMSAIHGERAFTKTAVPAKSQILMHADTSFYKILLRDYEALESGVMAAMFNYFRRCPGQIDF